MKIAISKMALIKIGWRDKMFKKIKKNISHKINHAFNQLKGSSAKQVIHLIGKIVKKASHKNAAKVIDLLVSVAPNPEAKRIIKAVKQDFERKGSWYGFSHRIFTEIDPQCLDKFINNLFINEEFTGLVKQEEFKKREGFYPPRFLLISPTMRCNLNCIGCSTRKYAVQSDWSMALINRILKEAKEMGIYFIATLGGETFIKKDMFDVYEKHNDMYFLQYTNGTLIDEKMAKKIAAVGNVAPAISVEGFAKQTDTRRGKGVWKKIIKAMEALKKEGVLFGFSATMTRKNAKIITSEKFIDFFIKQGCSFGWYFQYIPIGKNPDISLMATPEQRNQLRKFVHYTCRKTKPIFIGDFWNDGPSVEGCLAGGRVYLHINNDGNVEPCGFVHFAADNIKEKSLKDILKSDFFREIRERQQAISASRAHSDNLLTPCMIIDQPWILREIVKKTKAYPTHEGAETIIKNPKIISHLNQYSKKLHKIMDPAWEKEYRSHCPDCSE